MIRNRQNVITNEENIIILTITDEAVRRGSPVSALVELTEKKTGIDHAGSRGEGRAAPLDQDRLVRRPQDGLEGLRPRTEEDAHTQLIGGSYRDRHTEERRSTEKLER